MRKARAGSAGGARQQAFGRDQDGAFVVGRGEADAVEHADAYEAAQRIRTHGAGAVETLGHAGTDLAAQPRLENGHPALVHVPRVRRRRLGERHGAVALGEIVALVLCLRQRRRRQHNNEREE